MQKYTFNKALPGHCSVTYLDFFFFFLNIFFSKDFGAGAQKDIMENFEE